MQDTHEQQHLISLREHAPQPLHKLAIRLRHHPKHNQALRYSSTDQCCCC